MKHLASALLFGISLSALSVQAYAEEDSKDACNSIVAACKAAGFKSGGSKDGIGLWPNCVKPILLKKPGTSSIPLPSIDEHAASACLKAHPTYAQ